jgi:hypothetical protein
LQIGVVLFLDVQKPENGPKIAIEQEVQFYRLTPVESKLCLTSSPWSSDFMPDQLIAVKSDILRHGVDKGYHLVEFVARITNFDDFKPLFLNFHDQVL